MSQSGNDIKEQILQQLENSLQQEEKICVRLLELFNEKKYFLLDSTGTNIDDLENIQRKINVLTKKLIDNLNNQLNNNIIKCDINFEKYIIVLLYKVETSSYTVNMIIENESFELEINE